MKIVILGQGDMLANLIEGAEDSGAKIVGVFRHERTSSNPIKLFFQDFIKSSTALTLIKQKKLHEIKLKSANSEEFKREILRLNADIILVGTWREKLKKEIVNLPTLATINVHPSLLPKYRGPNPYIQTILHGEKYSGVTFHLMDERFDNGAILPQQKIEILQSDTSKELKAKTVFQARLLCTELLKKLDEGIVMPVPQNENEATYYPNITGNEKMLNFEKQSSTEIINTVRALHPFLPCYITHENDFYIVNPYKMKISDKKGPAGTVLEKDKNKMIIACKDEIALEMEDLKKYDFLSKFMVR